METVDTLISARWIIPIEPAARVLERHSIAIRQGRIVALLPTEEADSRYSTATRVDRGSHVLIPGFVNVHADAATWLTASGLGTLRGRTPASAPEPDFVEDATRLAIARLLSSGTTCFTDLGAHPRLVAQTAAALHARAVVGLPILEQPSPWAASTDESFDKALSMHDEYRADPLISTVFAPGSVASLSDITLQRLRRAADEIELPVLIPLHESASAVAECQRLTGMRPLERLEKLNLATPQLAGLHLTQLSSADVDLMAKAGANAVAVPRSDLYRRSGSCPVTQLLDAHVNTAVGTGGGPRHDMQGELRFLHLLAGDGMHHSHPLDAEAALRMATLGGAQALGLQDTIGSLLPGKWADLCCIDLSSPQVWPGSVLSQLIAASEPGHVTDVWVAGRRLLEDRTLIHLDIAAAQKRAARWNP